MTTRRRFISLGAAAAAAAIPVEAAAPPQDVVGPILLERVCDFNKSSYTAEDIAMVEAANPPGWTWGCGTRFQWFFGTERHVCPNCGYHYMVTVKMLKSGMFRPTGRTR